MKSVFLKMAVPAILLGAAFFLTGCQGRVPAEKEGATVLPPELVRAESYRRGGNPGKALDIYKTYLERRPGGEFAPFVLHHAAKAHSDTGDLGKSLSILKRLIRNYPDYDKIPEAIFEKAKTLYQTGKYLRSTREGLEWLKSYPSHHLKPDVMIVLGDNAREMENSEEAFEWWIRASRASMADSKDLEEATRRIHYLVRLSSIEELEKLAMKAEGTGFAPEIYHSIAGKSLLRHDTQKAAVAVQNLLASTSEEKWLTAADRILKKIESIRSVDPLVLGCVLPLTGDSSPYGREVLNGIKLGMGLFSESEEPCELELVIRDSRGRPEKAARAVQELFEEEKCLAVIGPLLSRSASASVEQAQNLGIPIITLTQKQEITQGKSMVFRNLLTPEREVEKLLSVAMNRYGITRFAILYPENAYGKRVSELFWERLEKMGGVVTAAESYEVNKTDFSEEIKKMAALNYPRSASVLERLERTRPAEDEECTVYSGDPAPITDFEAVFIPDTSERVAMIAPQLLYHDVSDVFLLGTSLWHSRGLIKKAGDYIQGALFTSGYFKDSGQPGAREFARRYQTNFNTEPGVLAATGYDTIKLIKEVIKKNNIRTRSDFRDALLWSTGYSGITGTLFFDFSGEVKKDPFLLTVLGDDILLLE